MIRPRVLNLKHQPNLQVWPACKSLELYRLFLANLTFLEYGGRARSR